MRTIAIINQKGGCGKTTTAINLAACLARLGHKTLLVDMDPQGHCATGLAVPEDQIQKTIFDCLRTEADATPDHPVAKISETTWQIATGFDLSPSNIRLAGFEQVFAGRVGREKRLAEVLETAKDKYAWCIVDCPPGVGLLTFNALVAADEVIIPVETGYFSLHGLAKMLEALEDLRDKADKDVLIRVLPTLYDTRTKLAREVLAELRGKFRDVLMKSTVNFNTKLKEAASFGQPITEYDPGSRGYKDFANLARELMGDRPLGEAATRSSEPMSRPAELVQRARQLAQLSASKFGRSGSTAMPPRPTTQTIQTAPEAAPRLVPHDATPVGTLGPRFADAGAARPDAAKILSMVEVEPTHAPRPNTQQKIDAFYGVRQSGSEVTFAGRFGDARTVQIAGDFNGWSALGTPMHRDPQQPNRWVAKLPLPTGRYRYRYVVDGRWLNDPHNRDVEHNEFGEMNNVLTVK